MKSLWWVGQVGIVIEMLGASLVVLWARRASLAAGNAHKTPTGQVSAQGVGEFAEWFLTDTKLAARRQGVAFGLIALGLLMQLIGNLGNYSQ